jgi:hypothetical protein
MNSTQVQGILTLISILAGTAGKLAGGTGAADITIGNDLLMVAQQALAQHAALNGKTMDEVLGDLHELPPLP